MGGKVLVFLKRKGERVPHEQVTLPGLLSSFRNNQTENYRILSVSLFLVPCCLVTDHEKSLHGRLSTLLPLGERTVWRLYGPITLRTHPNSLQGVLSTIRRNGYEDV